MRDSLATKANLLLGVCHQAYRVIEIAAIMLPHLISLSIALALEYDTYNLHQRSTFP